MRRRLLGVGTAALLLPFAAFTQGASREVSHGVEVIRGQPVPQKSRAALMNDANSLREQVRWLQSQLRLAREACPAGAPGAAGSGTGGSGSAGIGRPFAPPGPKTLDTRQVQGRLVWVDPGAIAMRVRGGNVLHLRVDDYTQAQRHGQAVPLSQLTPGESVRAQYVLDAGATAIRVDIVPREKKAARRPHRSTGARR